MKPKPDLRELTETELRARLKEHMGDRVFQDAAIAVYRSTYDLANLTRGGVAERRDAYKWVAALSTAAFFFVGQALPSAGVIQFEMHRWLLAAEIAFGLSILGAAGYLLVVDTRVAAWMRDVYRHSVRVTTTLQGMDANAMNMRDALEERDLIAANAAFKATYRDKETLGEVMSDTPPDIPLPGRLGTTFEYLCVGGLLAGVALVGADLVQRVAL